MSWTPAPSQTTPLAASASFAFAYDATNRRVNQTATDNSWWSYPTAATNVSYTANNLNQYTAVGGANYGYDKDGNLTVTTGPDGGTVYISNAGLRSVSAVDTYTMKLRAVIPVGEVPKRINTLVMN